MVEKQRILLLIPSLRGGGAERTLINLLQRLDYTRFEIDLVSVLNKGPYLVHLPENVKLITLFDNEFLLRVLTWLKAKTGVDFWQKYLFRKKIKKHYHKGICFLDSSFTDYLFYSHSIDRRFAWVHSSCKTNWNYYKFLQHSKYRERLKKHRYQNLDGICFVSHDAMQEFVEVLGEFKNMQVVYNIIGSEEVKKKAEEPIHRQNTRFTFIAVGSLLPVKGFDRLIRSSKILAEKGHDFQVVILGSGYQKKELHRLVASLDLKNIVFFQEFVSNPYPLIQQADVFVMSSLSEALPTVLCEAMILGKPTLVTNCSGCREVVNHGEFGLMAEQDDGALAAKMEKYLLNPELLVHFAEKSRERSLIFNDEATLEAYNRILSS